MQVAGQSKYEDTDPLAIAQADLRANLNKLNARDQIFARDLLSKARPKGGQIDWIFKLAERTKQIPADPALGNSEKPKFIGFDSIVKMMQQAAQKLKNPKVMFAAGVDKYRLSIAGNTSVQPGTINITSTDKAYSDREWFGRISLNGEFEPSRKITDMDKINRVASALKCFAENPAGIAKIYGQQFGSCCFCGIKLTDARSVQMGYGPICADNYGLPWGE